jgi:hypothetical protein
MRLRVFAVIACLTLPLSASQQTAVLTGYIDWEKMEAAFDVSLNLAESGFKLPNGRPASEAELERQYRILVQPVIAALPVNSEATVGSLVERGSLDAYFTESAASLASSVPPHLSTDFTNIRSTYRLQLDHLKTRLPVRQNPVVFAAAFSPVTTAAYTGIIVIADGALPAHGKRSTAVPEPCLSPKIWDADMNLLFDGGRREDIRGGEEITPVFRYMNAAHILSDRPGGLSSEAESVAGKNPLRIIASSVFGKRPTDMILNHIDAIKIISNEANRRLFYEGKLIIILNDTVLRREI